MIDFCASPSDPVSALPYRDRMDSLQLNGMLRSQAGALNWLANLIWGIADDVPRDLCVRIHEDSSDFHRLESRLPSRPPSVQQLDRIPANCELLASIHAEALWRLSANREVL